MRSIQRIKRIKKFLVELFSKKLADSKGRAFSRTPQSAKGFIVRRSLGELENLFAREKVLENRLQVESNLKNYPVDDF